MKESVSNQIRSKFMSTIINFFSEEEILVTASNEIAIPTLDSEGNELFVTIKVSVPKGSRDGEPYDGYGVAQAYQMKLEQQAAQAEQAAKDKAKKIARDKALRAEKAALRAIQAEKES